MVEEVGEPLNKDGDEEDGLERENGEVTPVLKLKMFNIKENRNINADKCNWLYILKH